MEEEYSFRGQRNDETVLLVVKQNPWIMAKTGFVVVIFLMIVGSSWVAWGASRFSSYLTIVVLLISAGVVAYRWFIWWNGMYILTNQRIIKIDQKSLFHRMISEAELDRIQDITTEIKGPVQTGLNFGTIHIQTASSQTVIDLTWVTDPYEVQQRIVRAAKESHGELPGKTEIAERMNTGS